MPRLRRIPLDAYHRRLIRSTHKTHILHSKQDTSTHLLSSIVELAQILAVGDEGFGLRPWSG